MFTILRIEYLISQTSSNLEGALYTITSISGNRRSLESGTVC